MRAWLKRRPRLAITLASAAALAGAWFFSGEQPRLGAPAAKAGDCKMIGVWSNGFHASLSMPAALFAPEHPLRQLYPGAQHLLIGWGDLRFYRSMGNDLGLAVLAGLPGGQSGMHVLAGEDPVETWYIGKEVLPVALSQAGVEALVAYITDSMALTPNGRASVVGFEQHGYFIEARHDFNALNVCNHWVVRAMRAAGVSVNAAGAFTGDMAIALIGAASPRRCP